MSSSQALQDSADLCISVYGILLPGPRHAFQGGGERSFLLEHLCRPVRVGGLEPKESVG